MIDTERNGAHTIAPKLIVVGENELSRGVPRSCPTPTDARHSAHPVRTPDTMPTEAETPSIIRAALAAMEFEWFAYYRVTRVGDQLPLAVYFGDYAPKGWPSAYFARGYHKVDPRLAFVCGHECPLVWNLSSLWHGIRSTSHNPTYLGRFIEEAGHEGLCSGVMFGIANPNHLQHTIISFVSRRPTKHWIKDKLIGEVYATGLELHALLKQQFPYENDDHLHPVLSACETQVLALLTQGESDRSIADQLQMSARGVEFHVRQLIKKYRAQNRTQLAFVAGRMAAS